MKRSTHIGVDGESSIHWPDLLDFLRQAYPGELIELLVFPVLT